MNDVDEPERVSCAEKESVYKALIGEEAEEMEDLRTELMELMVAEVKSQFSKIWNRLTNVGQPL